MSGCAQPRIQTKEGRLECPVILGWTRRQTCRVCVEIIRLGGTVGPWDGADPHHVDGKGMGGARCRDDRVVAICREHHDHVHTSIERGTTVGLVTQAKLDLWALENLADFLERASPEEVRSYVRALERWKERPLWIPS